MALTLPPAFPFRDLAIVITFAVILTTLLLQGLTLPTLIRRLPIERDTFSDTEVQRARAAAAKAALTQLDGAATAGDLPSHDVDVLRASYELRADGMARTVELQMLDAERAAAIALRHNGDISDDVLREIEAEIDMRSMILRGTDGLPL